MRVGQSYKASLIETAANLAVGLALAMFLNWATLKARGLDVSWNDVTWLTGVLTVASIVRQLGMRRFFNWLFIKGWLP